MSGRQVAVPVDGHNNEAWLAWSAEVMVTAADVNDLEAGSLEGPKELSPAEAWEGAQGVATSSSTSSTCKSGSGIGSPSLAAASKYPRMASRVSWSASSRVSP